MKILQVNSRFLPAGGAEIYFYNLSKQLSKKNNIYLFFGDSKIKEKSKNGYFESLPFTAVRTPFSPYKIDNKTIENIFVNLLDKFNPDIVHFHNLKDISFNLPNIASKKNIPTILTLHSYDLICPRTDFLRPGFKLCYKGSRIKCFSCFLGFWLAKFKKNKLENTFEKIKENKNLKNNTKHYLEVLYYLFYKYHKAIENIKKNVDLFIAPSLFIKDRFIESGFPQDKIIYCRYGIFVDDLKNLKKSDSEYIRFGFIGRITEIKGVKVLIEAFNKINQKTELYICGFWNQSIKRELANLIKNQNIYLKDPIFTNQQKKDFFSKIDVLIVPSIWFENCPLVILEAFATKTPVIASDLPPLRELIEDNKTGLLFKVGNPDELAKKIRFLIHNPYMIKKMSLQIDRIKTIDENAEEMEKIYKELIRKKNENMYRCRNWVR